MKPVVSIGNQNFRAIREHCCFYIDKTGFLKEWWENEDIVTLITRPRRFGKTLNMSMVESFFSCRYAGSSDLFEGLSIWKEEAYRKLQGSYPVIFLSFADIKADSFAAARMGIIRKLVKLYSSFRFVKDCEAFGDQDLAYFDSVTAEMPDDVAVVTVNYLSGYLNWYYGKKAIILLDEYDTPLQEAYVNGYWREMVSFVRCLFNSTFKTNPYLERGLMTGITRVSRESVFSDLNNLEVVTTTSEKYQAAFGFTQEEVRDSLALFGLSGTMEKVKFWYDGFQFGNQKDIYNPWSITKYLDSGKFKPYWVNTSSNSLVGKLIQEGSPEMKIAMEDLLAEKPMCTSFDEEIVFSELDESDTAVWSLLLASGYLKIEPAADKGGEDEYYLSFTNFEVQKMFRKLIQGWFHKSNMKYNDFIKALLLDDIDFMNEFMNDIALKSFSFFDTGRQSSKKEPERFFHGFVLGLIVELADQYRITSNRESGFGRYDIVLEPFQNSLDAMVIEFKVYRPKKEKNLQETVGAALAQIKEMDYDEELLAKGIPAERIRHYGFAFEGKKVLIGKGMFYGK